MIPGLVAHLWQSTLFAGVAWLLTLALRRNQAQVRYRIWFIASVKFLVPFSLLVGFGSLFSRSEAAPPIQTGWVGAAEHLGQPLFTIPAVAARVAVTPGGANPNYFAVAAVTLWACGLATIAICWLVRWKRVRALRRSATPVMIPGGIELTIPVMSIPGLVEPGIFGVFRPDLLLPEGIQEQLDRAQLEAILAHELCHVHRHDNLTAAIHMVVQATFWFHPLVWWLGARLVDERERACDEEVLRLGSKPQVYAAGILNICKLYVEAPLVCVSGVTGSNLKRRIHAIMKNRMAPTLSIPSKVALAVIATAAVAVPIIVGIAHAPPVRAQAMSAQSGTAATPKFEVASIRLCKAADGPGGRKGGGGDTSSPERLLLPCQTVKSLVDWAYIFYANGRYHPWPYVLSSGGPAWINSDLYQVEAKAEGPQSRGTINGPMLQRLLEDRFKLKTHSEVREVPVYALTVAKGGPRLQPFKEGSCTPMNFDNLLPAPEPGQPLPQICGMARGGNNGYDVHGETMADLCTLLSTSFQLGREVIDKTGIAGKFDIHLELSLNGLPPGRPSDPLVPTTPPDSADILAAVQTAMQKLGLKIDSTRSPGTFLVIDSVERPSEN